MAEYSEKDKKKIAQAKSDYADAKARGDADGMARANDTANKIRNSYGDAAQHATVDIKSVADRSSGNSNSNNSKTSSRDALINQYVDAAKQAKINQLKNAYNQNINAIAQQERETTQNAQADRNSASVQSQLAQRQLDNYLAANGLLNSGTNAQARINNVGALQNTLGGITANEQNALNQLANQRTLAKTNLNNDITAAKAGYDAQALQMQLQYLDQLEQMRMQQEFANQQALQQRQWALEDRDYNRDMNYIWDNNLGRYIDNNAYWNNYWNNNLTAYQKAQLANANRTSSGGSSASGTSSTNTKNYTQYGDLSNAQQLSLRKEYNELGTEQDFDSWLYDTYGIGIPKIIIGNTSNELIGDATHDKVAALNEYIKQGQIGPTYFIQNRQNIISQIGQDNYDELYSFASSWYSQGRTVR